MSKMMISVSEIIAEIISVVEAITVEPVTAYSETVMTRSDSTVRRES